MRCFLKARVQLRRSELVVGDEEEEKRAKDDGANERNENAFGERERRRSGGCSSIERIAA